MKKLIFGIITLAVLLFSLSVVSVNGHEIEYPYNTYHHGYHWQAPFYLYGTPYMPPGYLTNPYCYNSGNDSALNEVKRWHSNNFRHYHQNNMYRGGNQK